MNLFDMADQNSVNLEERYRKLETECGSDHEQECLRKFASFVKDNWRMSINMQLSVVLDFLEFGRYKNIYELKKDQRKELEDETGQKPPVEEGIHRHLRSWYGPRTTFDRSFDDGEQLKYGCVNTGGLGSEGFGPYCAVMKRENTDTYSRFVFIKLDSAENYVNKGVKVDELSQDVANREHVHHLATVKHHEDVRSKPETDWASMICCSEDYIEAATTDDIVSGHVGIVRMSKTEHATVYECLYKAFNRETEEMELYQLLDFRLLRKRMQELQIELEVTD